MQKYLDIIKQGKNSWNEWRSQNPELVIELPSVNLSLSNLEGFNLEKANLWEADFKKANLSGSRLQGADLCFANLSGADLQGVDFSGANLTEADLCGANLSGANLHGVNLWGADISSANLTDVDLSDAELSDAKLMKAKISHTDFSKAKIEGADFSNAIIEWSNFGDLDLSMVIGLKTVRHCGPSTVGIDTICRSHGKIPDLFLRGTGIPGNYITGITSLGSQPVKFESCFISYAGNDRDFAQQLHKDIFSKGIRCWSLPEEIKNDREIIDTIRSFDKMLLILSKDSLATTWLSKEVTIAIEEERKRKEALLYPIRLDSTLMSVKESWAKTIRRTRRISDFVFWEDTNSYRRALTQLFREIWHVAPWQIQATNMSVAPDLYHSNRRAKNIDFPETVYVVIKEKNCPIYDQGEQVILSGRSILSPSDKPTCLLLAEDVMDAHIRFEGMVKNDSGYAFDCSGCNGKIRLEYSRAKQLEAKKQVRKKDDGSAFVGLLNRFTIFETLQESEIKYFASFLKLKNYIKSDIVIEKGEAGENLFIIADGIVEVIGEGGMNIAFMKEGDVFGEMSLLTGNPAGATIQVVEPTRMLYIDAKNFKHVLNKIPSLQMYFTQLIAKRLNAIHDVRSEEFQSGMVGMLSEMPPSELFQTLNMNRKTGVLTIETNKFKAFVSFRDGNLIRAKADQLEGSDAFYALMALKHGRFKFVPELPPEDMETPELGEFMWLLMEGARRVDEEERTIEQ